MKFSHSSLPHGTPPMITAGNTTNPIHALLLLHGRGASAENIISLTDQLTTPDNLIIIAPQAADYTWYPQRFIVPKAENQPYLDSALERIATILTSLRETYAINTPQVTLAGFSQGACLVAEYVKSNPARYRGVAVFSGGLIGSDDEVTQNNNGDLERTPIYLGCDQADFHIPADRVEQTAKIFTSQNADVALNLYPNLGHTIHTDGLAALQQFIIG